MAPYQWTLMGLTTDIVGAFLLSVEAIKLENLRRIRLRLAEAVRNPDPDWVLGGGMVLVLVIICAFGWFILVNPQYDTVTIPWIPSSGATFNWIMAASSMVVIFILLLPCAWIFTAATSWVFKCIVAALGFIETRTPNGTIGLIGFTLIFAGFVLQGIGTWLGR
jgi:hypothetical protein